MLRRTILVCTVLALQLNTPVHAQGKKTAEDRLNAWVLKRKCLKGMAGTTRLELATSAVRPPERFYKNLQDRGDCQGPPKSFKIAQDTAFCGLGCGLENISF